MSTTLAGQEFLLRIRVDAQQLDFELTSRDQPDRFEPRSGLVAGSTDRLGEMAEGILHTLEATHFRGTGGAEELAALGAAFFSECWPEPVRNGLRGIESGSLLLHLDPALIGIPWELAHDGQDFLGCRLAVGRRIEGWNGKGRKHSRGAESTLRALLLANPTGDLPSSAREGEFLEKILSVHDVVEVDLLAGRIGRRAFLESLSDCDVLHYSGHFDSTGGTPAWRLLDGPLTVSEIASDQREGKPVPSLFFNNACHTEWMARGVEASASSESSGVPTRLKPRLHPGGASPAEVLMRDGCLHYIGVLA